MRAFLNDIRQWMEEGKQVALATLVKAYGSAPRPLGSKMVVSSKSDMIGSVSGGCVEGNVFEVAQSVLNSNHPRLLEYGIADELAFEVIGLACGGSIEVFVEPMVEIHHTLAQYLENEELVALVTNLSESGAGDKLLLRSDGTSVGSLGNSALEQQVQARVPALMATQQSERAMFEVAGEEFDLFIEVYPPPPTLIIVGAVHIAESLVTFANRLGFKTVIVDARAAFATPERFPHADYVRVEWPATALAQMPLNQSSYIVFLSHDEKMDNPALVEALNSSARYIGALGSRKTHAKRISDLKARGVSEDQLARIYAPVGLDLGAKRAEEIAVSIIAQIIAAKYGRGTS